MCIHALLTCSLIWNIQLRLDNKSNQQTKHIVMEKAVKETMSISSPAWMTEVHSVEKIAQPRLDLG